MVENHRKTPPAATRRQARVHMRAGSSRERPVCHEMVEKLLSGGTDRPLMHDMTGETSILVWGNPTRRRSRMAIGLF